MRATWELQQECLALKELLTGFINARSAPQEQFQRVPNYFPYNLEGTLVI